MLVPTQIELEGKKSVLSIPPNTVSYDTKLISIGGEYWLRDFNRNPAMRAAWVYVEKEAILWLV